MDQPSQDSTPPPTTQRNLRPLLLILSAVIVALLLLVVVMQIDRPQEESISQTHREIDEDLVPSNLTQEEIEKLQAERKAYHKDTQKLRQDIYQKELALRSELVKENPDAQKALEMQKEISDLSAEMDQKRVNHLIKVREIAPNAGRGMMKGFGSRGGGRGMGPGYGGGGRGMGSGFGGGPCWQ